MEYQNKIEFEDMTKEFEDITWEPVIECAICG